ncbi:MAG: hypothetical protein WBH47_09955 [Streptosporangiaceae bacterium]
MSLSWSSSPDTVRSIQRHRDRRQLARISRRLMAAAMTVELAIERGDWETVHSTHDLLVALYSEYREQYRGLLVHNLHR